MYGEKIMGEVTLAYNQVQWTTTNIVGLTEPPILIPV